MGCLRAGMWEQTQGRLEVDTRDFSGKETERRNRRDRERKIKWQGVGRTQGRCFT